ncbi:MAG: hypothetical protein HFE68_04935 [Erysipelotrichaceae bacterium]|nr:hypothetical protein [Erysipelotrichaceae bacterium]
MGRKRTKQEKHIDKRIKEELTRYYEYKEKIPKLKARKKQCELDYKYELNNPPYGGSVVKMPQGNNEKDPVAMKWEKILAGIDSELEHCERQVHKINNWLSVLTQEQYNVITVYVCKYQCHNRSHAALDLKCGEDNVKDRMNDGIERIRKNFDNII